MIDGIYAPCSCFEEIIPVHLSCALLHPVTSLLLMMLESSHPESKVRSLSLVNTEEVERIPMEEEFLVRSHNNQEEPLFLLSLLISSQP